MNTKVLFKNPLNLLGLFGFRLTYGDEKIGRFVKAVAAYSVFCVSCGMTYHIYYLIADYRSLDEAIDVLQSALQDVEALVKLISFLYYRKEMKDLIDEITKISNEGW